MDHAMTVVREDQPTYTTNGLNLWDMQIQIFVVVADYSRSTTPEGGFNVG